MKRSMLLAALTFGCGETVTPSDDLDGAGINWQATPILVSTVGRTLRDSLRANVTDADGVAIPDASVRFIPFAGSRPNLEAQGSGIASPANAVTGADGVATTSWTLGGAAGTQTLAAILIATGDTVYLEATANPGPSVELYIHSGDAQTAPVNTQLPDPLVVHLRDSFGNDTPGVTVIWTVLSGGGAIVSSSPSDSVGLAGATWRLGPTAGTQTVSATDGLRTLVFTAQANE